MPALVLELVHQCSQVMPVLQNQRRRRPLIAFHLEMSSGRLNIRRSCIQARNPNGGTSEGHLDPTWLRRVPARRHLVHSASRAGLRQARGRAHRVRVPGLRLRLRRGDALRGRARRVQLPSVPGSEDTVHDGERVGGGDAGHHQGG